MISSSDMKLSAWAKQNGVHYQTAYRWYRRGILPVPARKLDSGTILVDEPQPDEHARGVALYARVSSHDQRQDLDRQLALLAEHATSKGLAVTHTVTEVGSGLNGARPKLRRLLANPSVGVIVVAHKDRLMRFGASYLESALAASGRRIEVVEGTEMTDDLVRDMIDVLTSFCARLYGRRSARNRAEKALRAARR